MNAYRIFPLRKDYDIQAKIDIFDQLPNMSRKLKYLDDTKKRTGFMPISTAFTDICLNTYAAYIPDLLHQPKKGVFGDLLVALQQYLTANGWLECIEARMAIIPRFVSVERFGRSWFQMQTVTASNYNDMVVISLLMYIQDEFKGKFMMNYRRNSS